MPGQWTTLKNKPRFNASTMLLLNDGNVMCQDSGGTRWFLLTPDPYGDYVSGSWSELAPMANTRLYYASAVLRDGRVVICGGEYSNVGSADGSSTNNETNACEIYNPLTDTWVKLDPPSGWPEIGDAACVVLSDGRFLIGNARDNKTAIFDPATGRWEIAADKLDLSSEESWVLLPDGSIIVAQAANAPNSERYLPLEDKWESAGEIPVNLVETSSREIGPGILLNDGRALFVGATNKTAIYTPGADISQVGTWVKGPEFPNVAGKIIGAKDAPGCLLPNGRVLLVGGPVDGAADTFDAPTSFFEFDGSKLIRIKDPVNAGGPPFVGRMLMVPSGQVLFAAGSPEIAVYTPDAQDGSPQDAWLPTIASIPTTLRSGGTFTIFGTQLNGRSQAVGYGDDASAATNYPLVCLRLDTGEVVYCRTFDHSTMAVATGAEIVSTNFQVPESVSGAAELSVIVNGIESAAESVFIQSPIIDRDFAAQWQFLLGSLADGPLWGWGPNGPVPIDDSWGSDLVTKAKSARKQMLLAMKSLERIGIVGQHLREQAAANFAPAVDPALLPHGEPFDPHQAIRIAAIQQSSMTAARAAQPLVRPRLIYRGGSLMTKVQVVSIFWGASWQQAQGATLANNLNDFLKFFVASSLIDSLSEYNTPTQRIERGTFGGTITVTASSPATITTDDSLRNLLRDLALNDPSLPRPSKNTLYCVFMPPGVQVKDGADASCTQFCGYHNVMDSGIFYAVLPYPGCSGCLNGHTDFDSLTITTSHEIVEAITDPVPGSGWYDNTFGEIGDIDNSQVKRVGAFLVQKEWSNRARRVI
jgi:Kelch motif